MAARSQAAVRGPERHHQQRCRLGPADQVVDHPAAVMSSAVTGTSVPASSSALAVALASTALARSRRRRTRRRRRRGGTCRTWTRCSGRPVRRARRSRRAGPRRSRRPDAEDHCVGGCVHSLLVQTDSGTTATVVCARSRTARAHDACRNRGHPEAGLRPTTTRPASGAWSIRHWSTRPRASLLGDLDVWVLLGEPGHRLGQQQPRVGVVIRLARGDHSGATGATMLPGATPNLVMPPASSRPASDPMVVRPP